MNWKPSPELVSFMKNARADEKPIVYIGFGSITIPDPQRLTKRIVKGVLKSGVRAIISKGWASRMKENTGELDEYPPECFVVRTPLLTHVVSVLHESQVDSIPHDWLFPQIDAAVHHGGAGTTGASLRGMISYSFSDAGALAYTSLAGIPTIIKPWFGDQFFWASRVQKLGAGLRLNAIKSTTLSHALKTATTDR